MLKSADRGTLVGQHFSEFQAIHHFLDRVLGSVSMAAPDFTFHVVLKEDAGQVESWRKIYCSVQKIADGYIKTLLAKPGLNALLD